MKCLDFAQLIGSDGLETSSHWQRTRAEVHLRTCDPCWEYAAQLQRIGEVARARRPTVDSAVVVRLASKILPPAGKLR